MIPSAYDGRSVVYVDAAKLQHSGVIVGQSSDRQWYYVQSDNPNAPAASWHFKVSAAMIEGVLQ